MKSTLLVCAVLLGLSAAPAFADTVTISFTNSGILSGNLNSGVVSTASDLTVGSLPIGGGPFGTLSFNLGSFTGSLKHGGSFTGGSFELDSGGAALFVTEFSGTWDKIGKGLYDLVGTFSGTGQDVQYSGETDQRFRVHFDDGRACLFDLNGTTTITAATVPEPGTWTLLGTGLLGLSSSIYRKLRAAQVV
jgi:hypothetical protein